MGTTNYSHVTDVQFLDNERSFVIQLISEINIYLQGRDICIKRAGGERTINGGHFVKFPDVLLFSDASQSVILQGWEAKCPDVPIDDEAFVNDAHNKARLLNCNSTVLWNFQYAQLHVCDEDGEFRIAESWTISPNIVDRESISLYENDWRQFAHYLIDKIAEYAATGSIKHRSLGDALTGSVMPMLINENKGAVSNELKRASARNVQVKAAIESWWATVKDEYAHDETDPFSAYAKIILVNWMNKFLFANIIQSRYDAARVIADITESCKISEAVDYFSYITEKCDFYNVFSELEYSTILPDSTWDDLLSFNHLLLECDMTRLESDYSHKILEDSISVAKRQIAGQYPTPEPLAKLMSEIAVRNAYGNAWDCCCGTGTIGCSIWTRKEELLHDVDPNPGTTAYKTTWMSDIHDFPLQVATQSISSLSPDAVPLLVFRQNVFDVNPGNRLNVVDPVSGETLEVVVPKFDSIVSNLPFVDFNTTEISWYDTVKLELKDRLQGEFGVVLSDRNDLYCYITLHLESLLADDGCICLLTSNSWLCTSAGDNFLDAPKSVFSVDGIYVNGKHRWFSNADVMNAILVLKKKGSTNSKKTHFGVIAASISDLEKDSVRQQISNCIITHSGQCAFLSEKEYRWEDVLKYKQFGLSYYAICQGASFLYEMRAGLRKARCEFDIARGTKSGQDNFFYSDDPSFVDDEFRLDLLKNLRGVNSFMLTPNAYAFYCDKSEDYLKENGYQKTLNHIRSVRSINTSCNSHRPYWYTLPDSKPLSFTTSMNTGGRLFFAGAPEGTRFVANQRVLCFKAKNPALDEELCLSLLNSTLGMLLIEVSAAPMALGALDTRAATFKEMQMLNPTLVSTEDREAILVAFEPLKNRQVEEALVELDLEDRKNFDDVVLNAYGLESYGESIRSTLKSMLEARLHRGL